MKRQSKNAAAQALALRQHEKMGRRWLKANMAKARAARRQPIARE